MRIKSVILFVLCVAVHSVLAAQSAFMPVRFNELMAQLPLECQNKLASKRDNICECQVHGKPIPVKISYDAAGNLEHLGLNIFSFDANLIYPNSVLSFLERSFLEYFIWGDPAIINKRNAEEKIVLEVNNRVIDKYYTRDLFSIIEVLRKPSLDFKIVKEANRYAAGFSDGNNLIKLYFPVNYQVVSGLDKKEYAFKIMNGLKTHNRAGNTIKSAVNREGLKPYNGKVMVNVGNHYFRNITSNKYYVCDSLICQPLFSPDYPLETFSNIFLLPFDAHDNITLDVEQVFYGNEHQNYLLSLGKFIDYFNGEYEMYFGLEKSGEEDLQGSLLMFNRNLNFVNLLHVKSNKTNLFHGKNTRITGKLYTNIPADNVKNLFAEEFRLIEK